MTLYRFTLLFFIYLIKQDFIFYFSFLFQLIALTVFKINELPKMTAIFAIK